MQSAASYTTSILHHASVAWPDVRRLKGFQIRPLIGSLATELPEKISARHALHGAHRANRQHLHQSAAPSQRAVTA